MVKVHWPPMIKFLWKFHGSHGTWYIFYYISTNYTCAVGAKNTNSWMRLSYKINTMKKSDPPPSNTIEKSDPPPINTLKNNDPPP